MTSSSAPLLAINNVEVIYDHVILVLKGVSLKVENGTIVALLGANGAGKTTTLKAISNLLSSERGDVTKGSIELRGQRIDKLTPWELVKLGVVQVMEGRHCFQHLTVEENLLTGSFTRSGNRAAIRQDLEMVYQYFPAAEGAPQEPGRLYVRRRAADDRHRPRADGQTEHDPAGRTVDGARATDRR
jgi:branched-chain amino acid transport system ATP-binding protein